MQKKGFHTLMLFFIPLISLLILTGCQQGTQAGKTTNQQDDYHTGTQGVVLELLPNSPPAKIYSADMSALVFNVKVMNKGAYDIGPNDMSVILTGYDASLLNFPNYQFPMSNGLKGKSIVYPNGGEDLINWQAQTITSGFQNFKGDQYSPVFMVRTCYKYRTLATPVVCIDPNPYTAVSQDKVCTVNQISLTSSQGAPVAVTKIEPTMMPNQVNAGMGKAMFKIYVSNVGGGTVLTPDTAWAGQLQPGPGQIVTNLATNLMDTCMNKPLGISDINKVTIRAKLGGNGALATCTPSVITLNANQGYTVCQVPFNQAGSTTVGAMGVTNNVNTAYTTQLNIELSYGYTTSLIKSVQIVNTDKLNNQPITGQQI